ATKKRRRPHVNKLARNSKTKTRYYLLRSGRFVAASSEARESVSSCSPPISATWAAAHFRKEFPHFCAGSISKKVLLKTSPVAEKEIRSPLINDVSREKV